MSSKVTMPYDLYVSTRGGEQSKMFSDAILNPNAENNGLYAPKELPKLDLKEISNLIYVDLAFYVLDALKIDQGNNLIFDVLHEAYSGFDNPENPALLKYLKPGFAVCELYHGPTRAFKDMALQPFMNMFSKIAKAKNENYIILAATSGDTGPAVLSGLADKPNLKGFIMYPDGGTSDVQRLQMTTQSSRNVKVLGINGDFDDAQSKLKNILRDKDIQKELARKDIKLSAANSVNFARIAFQIVYHFWSYFQFVKQSEDMYIGNRFNSVIPSGNFGNALAAYYARKMGLPIDKIIIATNENNVLSDFINKGVYDLNNRALLKTSSPAMDILKSSNVERILFDLFGADRTKNLMEDLENKRVFSLKDSELEILQSIFLADSATEKEVVESIVYTFTDYSYVIDPHTANAFVVSKKVNTYNNSTIIYSTAEWTKFSSVLADAFNIDTIGLSEKEALEKISEYLDIEVPSQILELFEKDEVHKDVVDIYGIDYQLLNFAGIT
jgi:threonine synthase